MSQSLSLRAKHVYKGLGGGEQQTGNLISGTESQETPERRTMVDCVTQVEKRTEIKYCSVLFIPVRFNISLSGKM